MAAAAPPPPPAGAPVVAVRGAVRRFGPVVALDGLSLEIARGELYGLVGPDGAGKTTLIRALAGLIDVDGGEVRVLGEDPAKGRVRERVGLMPQAFSLYRDLSVAENLRFFSRLNALPRAEHRRRTERLLAITRLGPFVDRRADALSGGMYKKLALACALLHEPEVLLLDEPTNGVDPVSRLDLWQLLYEFVAQGMAVVVSTPYMDEAERCHRVGLLHRGRLLLEGEPQSLVAGFPEAVLHVAGAPERVEAVLERAGNDVYAVAPHGGALRVVVRRSAAPRLAEALAAAGAAVEPLRPNFEDLFLVRAAAGAAPEAAA